jgi:hypothetical protein
MSEGIFLIGIVVCRDPQGYRDDAEEDLVG